MAKKPGNYRAFSADHFPSLKNVGIYVEEMAFRLPNHKIVVLLPVGVVIIPLTVQAYSKALLSIDFEQPSNCPNLPDPLDPKSRLG
ncbi:MAG: hypothetical protein P8J33_09195, partial [Pirellulaceae bacterium]|nr:hypothetical protein [Pirellulaceae bacterium]